MDFHDEDMVMSDLDVEPLRRALGCMEHIFRTLLPGSSFDALSVLLTAQGTRGTAVPHRPKPEELLKVQMETDQYVSAGPEDEFEPDWWLAHGPRPLCCHPSPQSPWAMAPLRSGAG